MQASVSNKEDSILLTPNRRHCKRLKRVWESKCEKAFMGLTWGDVIPGFMNHIMATQKIKPVVLEMKNAFLMNRKRGGGEEKRGVI